MIRWRFVDPNPVHDVLEEMIQAVAARRQTDQFEPMPINVHQTATDLVIEAALPGVDPEQIDLSCEEGFLTIRATAPVPDREYFHQEIRTVDYMRQVALPTECRYDQSSADFEHGILRISIPRRVQKAPEKIRIEVNRVGGAATIEATKGSGYTEVPPRRVKSVQPRSVKPASVIAPRPGRRRPPTQ